MIDRYILELSKQNHYLKSIILFRRAIYSVLALYTMLLMVEFDALLCVGAPTIQTPYATGTFEYLFNALYYLKSNTFIWTFLFFYLATLLLGIIGKYPAVAKSIIFYATVLLFNKIKVLNSGGHNLVQILLFFNLFFSSRNNTSNPHENLLSNVLVRCAQIQVVFMYCCSLIFKLQGQTWAQGTALEYVLLDPLYSIYPLTKTLITKPLVLALLTYATLIYHLLFVGMVFTYKYRNMVLALGLAFHLYIFTIVKLPDFSGFVLASYPLFLKNR